MNNERGTNAYARFLDGDERAFEEIINEYRSGLTFFINRYVHNVDVAEDLAADVFAYLIFKPQKYNFKVTLKTYLYMMGRSRALDWLRKESKRRQIPLESLYSESSRDELTLEEAVIKSEEKRKLYKSLDKLPDNYKTALHLVYFEGLKYEEVGKVMNLNKKQVENIVYRAKKALKNLLEESSDEK